MQISQILTLKKKKTQFTQLLTALKTVDGAGSGLDADLLDGQSGSYYRIDVYNTAGTLLN